MDESHRPGFTPDRRRGDPRQAVPAPAAIAQPAPDVVQRERSTAAMWTAEDVAAHLKVSLSWVRHRVAANKLPHHRIGGWIIRFDPAEIRAWATSRGKR
jgi:excisionase family DNA binding protein